MKSNTHLDERLVLSASGSAAIAFLIPKAVNWLYTPNQHKLKQVLEKQKYSHTQLIEFRDNLANNGKKIVNILTPASR